jgi:ethanolamine ammonia-lyase large subunit
VLGAFAGNQVIQANRHAYKTKLMRQKQTKNTCGLFGVLGGGRVRFDPNSSRCDRQQIVSFLTDRLDFGLRGLVCQDTSGGRVRFDPNSSRCDRQQIVSFLTDRLDFGLRGLVCQDTSGGRVRFDPNSSREATL